MLRTLKLAGLRLAKGAGLTTRFLNSEWRRQRLLILCYHGISLDDEHLWSPGLYMPVDLFRTRMAALAAHKCAVLPLGEAIERLYAGTLPKRSVAVTFDDGTQDFYSRAYPVLKEFGVPATVYVTTYYAEYNRPAFDVMCSYLLWKGRARTLEWAEVLPGRILLDDDGRAQVWKMLREFAERTNATGREKDSLLATLAARLDVNYDDLCARRILHIMNPSEIAELAGQGVDVQLHTHRHRAPVQRDAFTKDIDDNRVRIEDWTRRRAEHFCYPSGFYVPEFFDWLRERGVISATTCETGICTRSTNRLALPRLVDTRGLTANEFDAWLSGLGALLRRRATIDPLR